MLPLFNRRAFVSLIIFLFISVILITSILMFFKPHTPLVALVHTGMGFILLVFIAWHLKNNFASLKTYFKVRQVKTNRPSFTLPVAIVCGVTALGLALSQSAPFTTLYEWGNRLRASDKTAETLHFNYVRADKILTSAQGNKLVIDLRKGPYFRYPQYAIWLETLDGKFIQPLFVTQKLAENKFNNKVTLRNNTQVFNTDISDLDDQTWNTTFATEELNPTSTQLRTRPESLPVFLHQLATQTAEPLFTSANNVNKENTSNSIDGYAGATLLENFLLSTQAQQPLPEQYRVRFEINQSFDFNTYYSSDRFPNDPIYSGDGYNGQPSVVYEAVVDTRSPEEYYPMRLIGHGHHSGEDGNVYSDMQNITTAKALIDRLIVETGKN